MTKKLVPSYVFKSISKISIEFLLQNNIKGVFIDLDGTLESSKTEKPTEKVLSWLSDLRKNNIQVIIISNNIAKRVEIFCQDLDIKFISKALKPIKKSFVIAMDIMQLPKENIAMIGDQIFTDVLGGNLFGIKTIYVYSIDKSEKYESFRFKLEEKFIRRCKNNG